MPIKYCPIEGGNFGDDLNTLLWPRLFPDFHRLTAEFTVFGIGTLLDGHHDAAAKKIVLGSGLGEHACAERDATWEFRWVRGPLTAQAFGISQERALGDSALLWPDLQKRRVHSRPGPVGLIPHYRTWDSFDWNKVGAMADMVVINPRQSPEQVIEALRGCSRVLAESLHGGICADALGVPWAPCILAHRFNEFKWKDWMATIDRPFEPLVADRPLVRHISCSKALANHAARWLRYKENSRRPALRPVAHSSAADAMAVAQSLKAYASQARHFACSSETALARQRERMQDACHTFAQDYRLAFTP
jgi:succinoglycan biosynthesis protein ExoV